MVLFCREFFVVSGRLRFLEKDLDFCGVHNQQFERPWQISRFCSNHPVVELNNLVFQPFMVCDPFA